jgi:hypothetical protein
MVKTGQEAEATIDGQVRVGRRRHLEESLMNLAMNIRTRRRGDVRSPAPGKVIPGAFGRALALSALLAPGFARASILSGEALDTAANVVAWVVLIVVPILVIVLFWIVHVMPEKIAHRNHHPQRKAIQTLCLLSLVFGGLLWPLAWLWAYTKPIGYRLAYGTEKHEDYYTEMEDKLRSGSLAREDAVHLREELEAMEARGALPPRLRALKQDLLALRLDEAAPEPKAVGGGAA